MVELFCINFSLYFQPPGECCKIPDFISKDHYVGCTKPLSGETSKTLKHGKVAEGKQSRGPQQSAAAKSTKKNKGNHFNV
jgi:hypothetical protein